MTNLDSITNKNNKEHNKKQPYVPDQPNFDYWWFWIKRKNALLNLIKKQDDIDKIYLYAKDLSEPKYKFLMKKRKNAGIKYLNNPNTFIECSNTMGEVYENVDDYNSN